MEKLLHKVKDLVTAAELIPCNRVLSSELSVCDIVGSCTHYSDVFLCKCKSINYYLYLF